MTRMLAALVLSSLVLSASVSREPFDNPRQLSTPAGGG